MSLHDIKCYKAKLFSNVLMAKSKREREIEVRKFRKLFVNVTDFTVAIKFVTVLLVFTLLVVVSSYWLKVNIYLLNIISNLTIIIILFWILTKVENITEWLKP